MPRYPIAELRQAYEHFKEVSDQCAATADYNAFADLFTDGCTYVEHAFGEMHGREEVRNWIVPLMRDPINAEMVRYTHDWVYFDEDNGRVIFCADCDAITPAAEQRCGGCGTELVDVYAPAT